MPYRYPPARSRRHGPRGYSTCESFRPWLRDEFDFRYAYSLNREQRVVRVGGFAIDHFLPIALHPQSCFHNRCGSRQGEFVADFVELPSGHFKMHAFCVEFTRR